MPAATNEPLCHRGICTREECGHCSREAARETALTKLDTIRALIVAEDEARGALQGTVKLTEAQYAKRDSNLLTQIAKIVTEA